MMYCILLHERNEVTRQSFHVNLIGYKNQLYLVWATFYTLNMPFVDSDLPVAVFKERGYELLFRRNLDIPNGEMLDFWWSSSRGIEASKKLYELADVKCSQVDAESLCGLVSFYNYQMYEGVPAENLWSEATIPSESNENRTFSEVDMIKASCILRMCAEFDFGRLPNVAISHLAKSDSAKQLVVTICRSTVRSSKHYSKQSK